MGFLCPDWASFQYPFFRLSTFWINSIASLLEAIVPDTLHSDRHKLLIRLLAEARRRAHLTQAQVAARLGRQQSFVANIEGNLRRVDVVEFLDLADAIGFEPSDLIAKLRKEKASHRRRSR